MNPGERSIKCARLLSLALAAVALAGLLSRPVVRRIVISKTERTLTAYDARGAIVKRFAIALGRDPASPKRREGDQRTPEGRYSVCFKNPDSRFHLSLGLDYPNPDDARQGLAEGAIGPAEYREILERHQRRRIPPWKTALGGEIFIHGGGDGGGGATAGCIALRDAEIEELFPLVALGVAVVIAP